MYICLDFLFVQMFIYKKEYDLPDIDIVHTEKLFDYTIWQPNDIYVVLGKGDKKEQAVLNAEVTNSAQKIYLMKRPSGGHSVVLTPKTLVISAVSKNKNITVKQMFIKVNALIIEALNKLGVVNLYENGISDISINDKKILGSSMYKNKDYLFYHAVLNISESPEFISSLLAHPTSEPEYRKKRSHVDFITSVKSSNPDISIQQIRESLNLVFSKA